MKIRNTSETYGLIAIVLHWVVALGFLAAYAAVYYRHWFTVEKTPANWTALQLHLSLGVTIAIFVILRVIWKFMSITPKHVPGTKLEHLSATGMHVVLYAIMIVMPITGYMGTKVDTDFFFMFQIPQFADTAIFQTVVSGWLGMTFEEFEIPLDFIHKSGGAYVVWVLVALHAGAALYHHYVRKDVVLKRMLSGARTP